MFDDVHTFSFVFNDPQIVFKQICLNIWQLVSMEYIKYGMKVKCQFFIHKTDPDESFGFICNEENTYMFKDSLISLVVLVTLWEQHVYKKWMFHSCIK